MSDRQKNWISSLFDFRYFKFLLIDLNFHILFHRYMETLLIMYEYFFCLHDDRLSLAIHCSEVSAVFWLSCLFLSIGFKT